MRLNPQENLYRHKPSLSLADRDFCRMWNWNLNNTHEGLPGSTKHRFTIHIRRKTLAFRVRGSSSCNKGRVTVSFYRVPIVGYNHTDSELRENKRQPQSSRSKTLLDSLSVRTVYFRLKVRGEFIQLGLFQCSIGQPVI